MMHVPKGMAASAAAVSVPLIRRGNEEERELVRMAQNGTEAAFEELVRRHQQRVFALVSGLLRRQEEVDDVAQQVVLKVYLSLRKFDQRAAFSTWLYRITVNECWDYLRKKKVRPLVYESDLSLEQISKLDAFASSGRPPGAPNQRAEKKQIPGGMLEKWPGRD